MTVKVNSVYPDETVDIHLDKWREIHFRISDMLTRNDLWIKKLGYVLVIGILSVS